MKIIVGLGNPGEEYANTRHNLGFMAIDKLAEALDIDVSKEKLGGLIGTGKYNKEKIVLVKPLTYMNLSGNCVSKVLKFYKATEEDLVVIYDDIDIEVGKIRVRPNGSAGTHNGMRDIVEKLSTSEFARIRIGSGKPLKGQDLANYVLGKFKKDELKKIDEATTYASEAALEILENGLQSSMNKFN